MEIDELPIAIGNFLNHRIHALKILCAIAPQLKSCGCRPTWDRTHCPAEQDGWATVAMYRGYWQRLQSLHLYRELIHVADHCHRL